MYNSVISTRMTRLYRFQPSSVVLCIQNSDLMTTITCVYGSQTSPVIFGKQNRAPSIRITNLYGTQPSSVVLCIQNSHLMTAIACVYGIKTSPVISACKTACLASELLVSMGPSPHLWFLDAKQRLLDPNSKSLWVPDINCRFEPAMNRD